MSKLIAVLLDGPIKNDGRVRRIIVSLSEDHQVDLYYINGSEEDSELFNSTVNLYSAHFNENWFIRNLFFHRKFKEIKKSFVKNNIAYDFIYCNDYPLLYTSVKLKSRNLKSQLIYDSHEIYTETINQFFPTNTWKRLYGKPLILLNKIIHNYIEKKYVKQVDHFVTVCNSFKTYFELKFKIKNIIVLKNCPKIHSFPIKNNKLRELLNIDEKRYILLYQGYINPGRGIEKMILAAKYLPNYSFVIIGDGYKLKSYKSIKEKNNINNFHFIGKIPFENLLEYTASADVGVMLIQPINKSKRLTLPNKVFEYMAAGIPVLTNHLPEASSIIKEEKCGFIIDDETPEIIASQIKSIPLNKLNELGENGQKAIQNKYNWDNEFKSIKKLFAV